MEVNCSTKVSEQLLEDPKSQYSHPLGENKGCQQMDNLFLDISTPDSLKSVDKCQRYGHFNACGSISKMPPKPIDWIIQPLQQPILRVSS